MSEVTILHINDMHSNFHSIKTQTRFMKERRAQLEKEGQKVFGIDLGDLIDRVHPLVEAEGRKDCCKSVERRANRFCDPWK